MTSDKILALPMMENDSGADTIGGYLIALLSAVWTKKEGFSGKRPFGNSGWEYDIYRALIVGGTVDGKLDEDGFIETVDIKKADSIIRIAIAEGL